MKICPIILSGGSGKRLWPLSRDNYPKQFQKLYSSKSIFIETILRLDSLDIEVTKPLIICNEEHKFLVSNELKEEGIDSLAIVLEPEGKNTAPAISLAAAYLDLKFEEDVMMLVLPSDHIIENKDKFHESIALAFHEREDGALYTFGIVPNFAHSGYGYLELSDLKEDSKSYPVLSFKEKPSLEKANEYLESGNFLWNSGMFMFSTSNFNDAIMRIDESIFNTCKDSLNKCALDGEFVIPDKDTFNSCKNISIDNAIMEKASDFGVTVKAVPLEAGWSDLGSWSGLSQALKGDENNNVIQGDVISIDTKNSYLYSSKGLVSVIGLDEIIIVNSPDALLVTSKNNSERVSDLVTELSSQGRKEKKDHREVRRPWGSYDSLIEGSNYQVKTLNVHPGEKLSLQLHHRRSEHWVVVRGKATVTLGEEDILLNVNESIYIPKETKHSLANNANELLQIVEVQCGDYLGEDDIVRFEDKYGRNN